MPDIYIISDYGKLYKKNDVFHFNYPDGTVSKFFPHTTERIFIIGRIDITTDAFRMLSRHAIEVVFMNRNGRFNGKLVFQEGKNVLLRKKQYDKINNENFKLDFCKSIVRGKIKNQLTFAQRILRERDSMPDMKDIPGSLKRTAQKVDSAESISEIRGHEGSASRAYFSLFKVALIPGWAEFKGRSMNPPLDNVNAVMSFIYTLMNQAIETQLLAEGLDTCVGYLHYLEYGRKSLVFDLMEEYRASFCDTLSISLFNLGILEEDDFREIDFSTEDDDYPLDTDEDDSEQDVAVRRGVLLTKEGLKKVIQRFEKKIEDRYYYAPARKSITYRRIIAEQVKHFKRVINDEEKEYTPFLIK